MKVKQYVHVTDVDAFIRGDYSSCFGLWDHKSLVQEWICLPDPVELEVNLDFGDLRQKAIDATDAEIRKVTKEATRKLEKLEKRKQELLAITYNPEGEN